MMNILNQKGFSLVEGMLIIAAVLLLSFGGYYVYSQNSKEDEAVTQQELSEPDVSAEEEQAKSENTVSGLIIQEEGIVIPVDDLKHNDLTYAVGDKVDGASVYYLYSESYRDEHAKSYGEYLESRGTAKNVVDDVLDNPDRAALTLYVLDESQLFTNDEGERCSNYGFVEGARSFCVNDSFYVAQIGDKYLFSFTFVDYSVSLEDTYYDDIEELKTAASQVTEV